MTDLVVRRLLIDLETPVQRHWYGGDAFRSAFLGALSLSFPVGEQFFIDSVRSGFKALPPASQARFQAEVQGFVGQEATHRRIHGLFNSHLERFGYDNAWSRRAERRIERFRAFDVRHHLAMTAAYEHFTAILAENLLSHPEQMAGTEPRIRTMWMWHAAEESEHKATAFDLYHELGGSLSWRRRWFVRATLFFVADSLRQSASQLRHDGELFRWRTLRSALGFFFGRHGLVRDCFGAWLAYFRADFHPAQRETGLAAQWLREHAAEFSVVGR